MGSLSAGERGCTGQPHLSIVLTAMTVTGCATWPAPPVVSQDELKARCERTDGWWRPNILDEYCEHGLVREMP